MHKDQPALNIDELLKVELGFQVVAPRVSPPATMSRHPTMKVLLVYLHASYRIDFYCPTDEDNSLGFRVSEVPEPASMAVLTLGSIGMLIRRRGLRR